MLDNKKSTAEDFKTAFKQLYDDKKQNNVNEFICLPLGPVREKIKIGLFLIERCELPASYRSFHQDYIILRPTIGKSSVSQTNPCSVFKSPSTHNPTNFKTKQKVEVSLTQNYIEIL